MVESECFVKSGRLSRKHCTTSYFLAFIETRKRVKNQHLITWTMWFSTVPQVSWTRFLCSLVKSTRKGSRCVWCWSSSWMALIWCCCCCCWCSAGVSLLMTRKFSHWASLSEAAFFNLGDDDFFIFSKLSLWRWRKLQAWRRWWLMAFGSKLTLTGKQLQQHETWGGDEDEDLSIDAYSRRV